MRQKRADVAALKISLFGKHRLKTTVHICTVVSIADRRIKLG